MEASYSAMVCHRQAGRAKLLVASFSVKNHRRTNVRLRILIAAAANIFIFISPTGSNIKEKKINVTK